MNCIDLAKKVAAGRLSQDEMDSIIEAADRIKERLTARGHTDNLEGRALRMAENQALAARIKAAQLRRQAAQAIKARQALDTQLAGFRKGGMTPVSGIRALWQGTIRLIKDGQASGYNQAQAYEARWLGSLFSEIRKGRPHVEKLFRNRAFDDAVTKELWELREAGSPGITKNADAQWLARVLAAHMEVARIELNRLGAAIGHLEGYAGPQVHDDLAMIKAGKEQWIRDVEARLDADRSFPEISNPDEIKSILSDIFDTVITGVHQTEASPILQGKRVGPANLASSLAHNRVLHFRDAAAAIEYRDLYGRGSTIQGILSQIGHHARTAGVIDKFGPNPKAMILSIAAREQQNLRAEIATVTDPKKLKSLQKQIDKLDARGGEIDALKYTIDDAIGMASRPVSIRAAEIGNAIRSWQVWSKLGGATITAMPTDTVTAAAAAMFRGQGFTRGLFQVMGELAQTRDGRQLAALIGEGFDGTIGHTLARSMPNDGMPGRASDITQLFFRLNGLTQWTDAARAATARVTARHLADNTGLSFDKLDSRLRRILDVNGIDGLKWEAIRKSSLAEFNGNRYLTPDAVRNLDDAAIEPLASDKIAAARRVIKNDAKFEAKKSDLIADARRGLELDLYRYYADETSNAIIETDAASRRVTSFGTRPGTTVGEAVRYLMQFKGFPIAYAMRVLGRGALAVRENPGDYAAHMGALMAGLTVAGYVAMTAKDAARGLWPPRDPASPKTLLAAALQGGALGIYGDFLFGQHSRYNQGLVETSGGPMVGNVSNAYFWAQAAASGDPSAGQALDMAIQNTPFVNLIYTRAALDYLFINSLREAASPGSLRRSQQNIQRERGQEYVLPRRLSDSFAP
jgi:hypothetical protein